MSASSKVERSALGDKLQHARPYVKGLVRGRARRRIAAQDEAQVFITEGLLTTLMCAPRSVYSWDVVITRAGGKLFFDRRDDSAVDLLTTAETAPEVSPCLECWVCCTASQLFSYVLSVVTRESRPSGTSHELMQSPAD